MAGLASGGGGCSRVATLVESSVVLRAHKGPDTGTVLPPSVCLEAPQVRGTPGKGPSTIA